MTIDDEEKLAPDIDNEETWDPQEDEDSEQEFLEIIDEAAAGEPDPEPKVGEPEQTGGVQKRIDELTRSKHEAERRAAESESRSAAEITALREKMDHLETGVHQQKSENFKQKYMETREQLKEATEEGNTELMISLNEKLGDMRVAARMAEARPQAPTQPEQPQAPQAAFDWWGRNSWFNTPERAAESAYAREEDLKLEREGRNKNSPDYYIELDKRLQKVFPQLYVSADEPTPSAPKAKPPIAPVKGGGGGKP